MILRALLVLLVVINLGVAAWWGSRAPPPQPRPAEMPAGVPRLQLLHESPRPPAARATAAPATAATSTPTQCVSFGPYPTPAALRRAHARVLPQVLRAQVREVASGQAAGWRVFLPPLSTRAEAQALAERMTTAGIDDLLVMSDGDQANGIALGRYRSEDTARRRQQDLQAAGFSVQVAPLGNVATEGWIDVAAGSAFDRARIAQDIAAAQAQPLDCATLAAANP
jgi:cell division protein FtsN